MTIDQFKRSIVSLQATNFQAQGGLYSAFGPEDSGSAQVRRVKYLAADFVKACYESKLDLASKVAEDFRAQITVAVTLGAVAEVKADELIVGMNEIISRKDNE